MTDTRRNPFNPEEQSEGKKFGWDERGVEILSAIYVNKTGEFGEHAVLELEGQADGAESPYVQYYFGDKNVHASEDGKRIDFVGDGKLGKGTLLAQFGSALYAVDAKLANAAIDDATVLVGYKLFFVEQEQKDREGKVKMREYTNKQGVKQKTARTSPVPKSIIAKPKGAGSGADEGVIEKTVAAIREVLAANGGSLEVAKLSSTLAGHLNGADPKVKTEMLVLASDRKFLKSLKDSQINFDGLRLSL